MAYLCQRCSAEGEVWPGTCPSCGSSQHIALRGKPQGLEGTRLGHYLVGDILGQGGMGTVYKAVREDLGQRVAIKVLNPDLTTDPEVVKRFLREARVYGTLSHPGVVTVHDLGQTPDGQLFIAMELVDGLDLAKTLKTGPLDAYAALDVAIELCDVLQSAHKDGIIHRDLKPENIMLTQGMRSFHVKVLDFGIARVMDQTQTQLTQTGSICGTPRYMSPEQARGLPVDARSDIYSLGLVLYEMLVGAPAYAQPSVTDLLHAQVFDPLPHLTSRIQYLPDLIAPLDAIMQRACAKDRAARFQTMKELGQALMALVPPRPPLPTGVEATLPPQHLPPDNTAPPATPPHLRVEPLPGEPVYEARELEKPAPEKAPEKAPEPAAEKSAAEKPARKRAKKQEKEPVAPPPETPAQASGTGVWTVLGVLAIAALLGDAAYELWRKSQVADPAPTEQPKQGVTRLPANVGVAVPTAPVEPGPLTPLARKPVLRPLSEVLGTTGSSGTTGHSRLDELLLPAPASTP